VTGVHSRLAKYTLLY